LHGFSAEPLSSRRRAVAKFKEAKIGLLQWDFYMLIKIRPFRFLKIETRWIQPVLLHAIDFSL